MKILPSIMCADQLHLADSLAAVEAGGADGIHVDIMDGHFVPGFTYGRDAVSALSRATSLPLDLHVMSDKPLEHAAEFWDLPVHSIVVHIEACPDPLRAVETIRQHCPRAGLALNPGTPAGALETLYPYLDRVVVMAVCPGFIGQTQIPSTLEKAKVVAARLREAGRAGSEVVLDGGVKVGTAAAAAASGVDAVVSGTGVFAYSDGIESAIRSLKDVSTRPETAR